MEKKADTSSRAAADKPKGKIVGAVVNAAKILRFLRSTQGPATVTQITRALKVNPSTCFNILRTLIQEDFVEFDSTAKTYQLSLGLVALARGALEHSPELQQLKPRIEALAREHHVMVSIWRKISDDRLMLAAAAESDAPVRIHARVGARSPLLLGASGRLFAAHGNLSKAALRERFNALRFARPLDFNTYLEQVAEARRVGWAIDDGYAYGGTVTIAAPVKSLDGSVHFTCAAILFNGQYDLQRVARIAEDLKRIGNSLVESAPPAEVIDFTPVPARAKPKTKAKAADVKRPRQKAAA